MNEIASFTFQTTTLSHSLQAINRQLQDEQKKINQQRSFDGMQWIEKKK